MLSVVQYALLIDEINKEITKHGLGDLSDGIGELIAYCLLWMDDVALISTEITKLQQMLDITDETANKYHIEFGEPKSKVLKIGKDPYPQHFHLGQMKLKFTDNNKYIGEVYNEK